jgi:uncharacterized protein with beta-barrel porin domain
LCRLKNPVEDVLPGISPAATAPGLTLKMSGTSELRCGFHRRRAVSAAVRTLAVALATVLLASEVARADCMPQAANNVTATCTGTTTNQAAGAPGTSGGTNGYGTGVETGIAVNVVAGSGNTVTGNFYGIFLEGATVTNNAGAGITGGQVGINANGGFANVTNSGSITGTTGYGVYAGTNATVTNNASASITGGNYGIDANGGFADVTNSGSIAGTGSVGIVAGTNATVTNNAGASITGGVLAIYANNGFANVTNSGSITGTSTGIVASTDAMVTNNAGASIAGGNYGIYAGGGGSSVFNAGAISGATAAIRFAGVGNTLTLAPGSAITGNVLGTGSDTFQLGGTGSATFDVSQIGAAKQYRGFGTFHKIDGSIWTLTGTSTFAGPVNVNGGTLSVNGDIRSSSGVTVNTGGTLAGTGAVGVTQILSGGVLSPGNAASPVGALTVSGSLAFQSAAIFMVTLNGTSGGSTTVSGATTIANGAVVAVGAGSTPVVDTTYTILKATGGVSGTFANQRTFLGAYQYFLSYDAQDVYLTVKFGLLAPLIAAIVPVNVKNVANGFDNAILGGSAPPVGFQTLFNLSPAQLLAALTQLSGETATGVQQTTFDAVTQFMGVMTDPFTAGRGEPSAPAFAEKSDETNGYAATGRKRSGSERDAYGMITKAAPRPPFEARWNVWAAGFGGSQTTDGNGTLGSNTATSRIGGVAVGADYWLSPQTVAGFALAGGGTNFSVNGAGSGRSDLFQAGSFVRHTIGSAYVTAAAAYGRQDITTDRTVTIAGVDQLRARFNANAYSGRVEGGKRYVLSWMGGIGLTPYAAAQVTAVDLPAYAEHAVTGANTFALAYGSKSVTASRSELGLRSDKSFEMRDGIFVLRGRVAWAHDYNTDRNIGATFQTLPGSSFVVNGAAQAPDAALVTASAEKKWLNGFSLAGTFEGEFSSVTRSYAGKGVARYSW